MTRAKFKFMLVFPIRGEMEFPVMLLIELTYFCNGNEERGRVSYYIMCARVHGNEVTSWFFQTGFGFSKQE